jgi:hypothetical protein
VGQREQRANGTPSLLALVEENTFDKKQSSTVLCINYDKYTSHRAGVTRSVFLSFSERANRFIVVVRLWDYVPRAHLYNCT